MLCLLVNIVSSQLIPLDNFHIAPEDILNISLPIFIPGETTEFSLSGSFNITSPAQPILTYSLQQSSTSEKEYPNIESSLQIYNNILYSNWDQGLILYNIQNLQNITIKSILNYTNNTIISVYPLSVATGSFLISLETGGTFRVINTTSDQEIIKMQFTEDIQGIISCSYLNNLNYFWAFCYNLTQVSVIRFDFLITFATTLYRRYESSDFNNVLHIVSLNIYQQLAYICDSVAGLLVYSIVNSLKNPTTNPTLLSLFTHPLIFGQIISCSSNGLSISVGTTTNVIVYQLPSLNFLTLYQADNPINVQTTQFYTVIQLNNNRMQVYCNISNISQSLIADQTIAFDSWALLSTSILLSNLTTFEVFNIYLPSISFIPQNQNYEYIGNINVKNVLYPIQIIGSYSSGIFNFQGPYPEFGYFHPSLIETYLYTDSFNLSLPLSNYFSGNNISYSFYTNQGIAQVSEKMQFVQMSLTSFLYNNYSAIPGFLIFSSSSGLNIYILNNSQIITSFNVFPSVTYAVITEYVVGNNYIIIESFTSNSGDIKVYRDIFNTKGQLLNSGIINSDINCSKMLMGNNCLYVLRDNCIEIYQMNSIPFISLPSICENSIFPTTTLEITDFTISNGIFLLNQSSEILYFPYSSYNYSSLSLPLTQYFSLFSTVDFVIATSVSGFYKISLTNQLFNYYYTPLSCFPTEISISYQFLSLFCERYLIIDLYAEVYTNIYTEIYTDDEVLITGSNLMISTMFLIKDQPFSIYLIGENLQSNYLPIGNMISSSFGTLNINNIENESTEIQLKVIANNQYEESSLNITLILWNSQYIEQNPDFNNTQSPLTSGTIDVRVSNFSAIVPLNAFTGNNITYSLLVDNTMILPSVLCENVIDICIENKLYEVSAFSQGVFTYDFWLNDDIIITSIDENIYILNISSDFIPVFYSKIDFSNSFQYQSINCMNIDVFIDNNTIVCAAIGYYNSVYYNFIFTGTFFGEVYSYYNISYAPVWMSISQIGSFVYLYEGVGLYIFIIQDNKLQYQAYYTEAYFQQPFNPVSAEYYNESTILIGDLYMGAIYLKENSLYQWIPIPKNGTLASLYTLSTSIIMLFSSGDGYQISTLNFTILQHFYKLYPEGNIPSNMKGAVNETQGILIYPIYKQPNPGYIRVVNITSGYIITDFFITPYAATKNFGRIALSAQNPSIFYHDLSAGTKGIALHTVKIRNELSAYIIKVKKEQNSSLQLTGIVGKVTLELDAVEVVYQRPSHSNNNGSSDNIYDRWWFWIIILGSFALFVVIGIIIYRKIKSRNQSQETNDSLGIKINE